MARSLCTFHAHVYVNLHHHEPRPFYIVGALELGLMAGTGGPYVSAVLCAFAALCLLLHITAVCGRVVSYPPLPFLFAEGSNYDVGHQIVSWS